MKIKLAEGMRVYVLGWHTYRPGTVTKVLPAGGCNVKLDQHENSLTDAVKIVRFTASGKEIGGGRNGYSLVDEKFEAVEKALHNEQLARAASIAVNAINDATRQRTYWQWGKDSLGKELDRIQAEVDAARKLVDLMQ